MTIFAMDLSLNCPGFAVLQISDGKVKLVDKTAVNNTKDAKKPSHKRKSTAQKLQEIARMIHLFMHTYKPDVVVRERGFSRHSGSTQALFRVVGVSDLMVYDIAHQEIYEMAPTAVKAALTGNGKAEKRHVAEGLKEYIGEQCFATEDESDAAAVGIAWAIQEKWIEQKLSPEAIKRNKKAEKKKAKKVKGRRRRGIFCCGRRKHVHI